MKDFFVTAPAADRGIYFMAETYYQDMIPEQCTSGNYNAGPSTIALTSPVVDITVYEDGATTSNFYKFHAD